MANLTGAVREKKGTRSAKKLRLQGKIPASIQGEDKPNVDIALDEREFLTARRQHEHLFDIEIEGVKKPETALVRELQWDTIGERILHVEFRRVVRGRKTEVDVELAFTGHPKGGVINHLVTHIKVQSLPKDIPDGITVNADGLEPGHVLHAKDLVMPAGVELAIDPETPIASVAVPRGIEEVAAPEEAPVAEGEEAAAAEAPAEGAEPEKAPEE